LKSLSAGKDCTADASCENVERGDQDKPSLFRHVKAKETFHKLFGLREQPITVSPHHTVNFQVNIILSLAPRSTRRAENEIFLSGHTKKFRFAEISTETRSVTRRED
jgi:hypothetical protein